MLLWWIDLRRWLWRRLRVPLPGLPGWQERLREYSAVPLWVAPGGTHGSQIAGLRLEYTLLRREDDRIVFYEAVSGWSGVAITGDSRTIERWGVRCARCGEPIRFLEESGMTKGNDVPSCPPCRKLVKSLKE